MDKTVVLLTSGIVLLLILLSAGCVQQQPGTLPNTTGTEVDILYAGGVGPMPVLIRTEPDRWLYRLATICIDSDRRKYWPAGYIFPKPAPG